MPKKKIEPEEIKKVRKPVKSAVRKRSVKSVKKETPIVIEEGLTAPLQDVDGKTSGKVKLPEAIFAVKFKPALLAQAVRVYRQNQRQGTQSTKTRSEVAGSTRKIRPQKGSGHARHGSLKAPVFVGGGVALGPKPRIFNAKLPRQLRRRALFAALSQKFAKGEIKFISGLEGLKMKTKEMALVLKSSGLDLSKKRKTDKILLVLPRPEEKVMRAGRNIPFLTISFAGLLNAYDVLAHKHILIMKEAPEMMEKIFLSGKQQK